LFGLVQAGIKDPRVKPMFVLEVLKILAGFLKKLAHIFG
jgi:hypothetical protein